MLAPSSLFSALRWPPSSSTATHMGRNFISLAFASALSTMTDAAQALASCISSNQRSLRPAEALH